ncbi:MAG: GAF domain-containing protein, partial [Proteobacteria bacterium]|nr:GAF domain-containing protein [Pseudomonadota bacterium]
MTAPHGDAAADYQNTIELLRQQLDAALAERAKLAEQLARRDSQYSERINHQGAAVDVLNAMVNSPDDPQPVFDLIVRQAVRLCDGMVAGVFTYDGRLVRHPAWYSEDKDSIAAHNQFAAQFPMPPSRGQASGRAILDGRAVHVKDVRADPYLSDEVQRLKERTIIAVPLIRDGRAVGAMAMNRREPGGFSDSQISLLETFSRHAVIAITSSETYRALQGRTADLQETLEQQTATADVLQVVNANPSNLTPVFETMLDHAMRLCEAEFGELYRFDGDRLVPLALIGIPRPLVEYRMTDQGAPIVRPGTNPWALLHGEDIVHTSDLINTEAYREGEPSRRALVDLGGVRTSLAVALRKDGLLAGMLVIYRQQVRPFTDRQVALLQNFAAQAVIAMENARLLTEQREALERQTATAEVLQVINASPGDLSPVYDAILEKAHTLCGVTHGNLTLYEDGLVRAVAMRGSPGPVRATISEPSRPSARHQRLIHGERLVHVLDIRAEQTDPDNAWTQAALDASGADWRRTGLWIPLRRDTRVMGWIAAFRNEVRAFTEKEISLLENFAAQAVIAMENARLLTEQREAL